MRGIQFEIPCPLKEGGPSPENPNIGAGTYISERMKGARSLPVKSIEKVVSTKIVYNGKILKVSRNEVLIPNGKRAVREILQHPGSVVLAGILDDGRLLMIRQFRLSAGKVLWEIPAGTIEEGEKPEDCAVRELKEETGYTAESMKLLFRCYPTPGYSTEVMHCFLATSLTRHRRELDEDEVISVKPTALEAVFRMIASGEIIDAKTIAVVSYLRAR